MFTFLMWLLDNPKLLMWLTLYFYWTARSFIGAMGLIHRVPSLLLASSAFPQAATHRTRLITHKSSKKTICRMFGNHGYTLFDEFGNCTGSDDLTVKPAPFHHGGKGGRFWCLLLSSSPSASLDPAHAARLHLQAPHVMAVLRSPGQHSDTQQAVVTS